MMQLRTLAALVLAATSLLSESGTTVAGRVTDPAGAGVPGAVVRLRARDGAMQRTTIAAGEGRYAFERVPASEYLVEAQADGFAVKAESVRVTAGGPVSRDIALELPRVDTHVVVTASSTAQTTEETAKAFDVIDAGQMRRRAEFGPCPECGWRNWAGRDHWPACRPEGCGRSTRRCCSTGSGSATRARRRATRWASSPTCWW
jgi:hypothetical protein